MSKGWKKLTSKIVHENPYYFIREDSVKTPSGDDGKYFCIDGSNSVMVIAEDNEGRFSLVGQTRYPIGNVYSWEFVSGGIEQDEDPLDAAKRELKEETGMSAENWEDLGYFYPLNGISSEQTYLYLAKDLQQGDAQYEDTEDISHQQTHVAQVLEMVKDGTITCGMTLAALQKYLLFTKKI